MKPIIRGPLSHHLFFRLTTSSSSISFSTSSLSINTPSLHTLSSFHLLTLSPSNTHFPISPNQPTPHHQFTHRRPFSSVRSDPSSIEPPPPNAIPVVSTVASPFESSPSIDAGSLIRKPISLWPGMYHSPVTNALWEARSSIFEKSQEHPSDAASESELVPKTPAQSRTSIIYKFSSDYILREQYRNPWNEIRSGKLLEDLDALAGTISFKNQD